MIVDGIDVEPFFRLRFPSLRLVGGAGVLDVPGTPWTIRLHVGRWLVEAAACDGVVSWDRRFWLAEHGFNGFALAFDEFLRDAVSGRRPRSASLAPVVGEGSRVASVRHDLALARAGR